jgi:hypothetical protein
MPVNKVKKYLKNLDKETNQAGNAGETLKKAKGTSKEKAAANKLRNERGQMFGALLQGRRYDEKGKQITKPAAKKTAKTPAKKKVVQMPSKINPSKMTPAQKAKYLQNPERYDK